MSDWKPDVCLYHSPCDDGFASAWIVRERWPGVELRPVNYGEPLDPEVVTERNVLIVDFSYPAAQLDVMGSLANSIVILDHHKTASAELEEFTRLDPLSVPSVERLLETTGENVLVHFDMERSGAALTWEFCFPATRKPNLIAYIEDRDLWRFRMQNTRKVSLLLRSYPYDFAVWTRLVDDCGDHDGNLRVLAEAAAIERYYDRQIEEIARTAAERDFAGFHHVAVAYAPYAFVSDVAHALLERSLHAPFAAIGVHAYDGLTWSLRSQDHREDVSAIAKKYGGGGHRNAAGFRSVL